MEELNILTSHVSMLVELVTVTVTFAVLFELSTGFIIMPGLPSSGCIFMDSIVRTDSSATTLKQCSLKPIDEFMLLWESFAHITQQIVLLAYPVVSIVKFEYSGFPEKV